MTVEEILGMDIVLSAGEAGLVVFARNCNLDETTIGIETARTR